MLRYWLSVVTLLIINKLLRYWLSVVTLLVRKFVTLWVKCCNFIGCCYVIGKVLLHYQSVVTLLDSCYVIGCNNRSFESWEECILVMYYPGRDGNNKPVPWCESYKVGDTYLIRNLVSVKMK